MSTTEKNEVSSQGKVRLSIFSFAFLDRKKFFKNGELLFEVSKELGVHLLPLHTLSLGFFKLINDVVVAVNHLLQFGGHVGKVACLTASVVPDDVYIVLIAAAVDLHHLQELHEVLKVGLPADSEDIAKLESAGGQIFKANDDQVNANVEQVARLGTVV